MDMYNELVKRFLVGYGSRHSLLPKYAFMLNGDKALGYRYTDDDCKLIDDTFDVLKTIKGFRGSEDNTKNRLLLGILKDLFLVSSFDDYESISDRKIVSNNIQSLVEHTKSPNDVNAN